MPVRFTVDPIHSLVLTVIEGPVTPGEMFAYHAALRKAPSFSPSFDCLTEYDAGSSFVGSPADIQRLVEGMPFDAGTRRAYVASVDLHFGLSRMAQVYAERKGVEVRVFRDRAAALVWLGHD
jgi:hypothetical protein